MRIKETGGLLTAAGFGAVAGMRSMAAPALLGHHLAHDGRARRRGAKLPERLLASGGTARALELLAAGELIADKTPVVPDRVAPLSLAGRAASGALVGAAVAGRQGRSRVGGALVGGAAAVASAYLFFHLRRTAVRRLHVPDTVAALAEDGLALAAGRGLLTRVR